jgi:hypothetical protein
MEKALNVGEACSPTGFESSFEGPGKGKRTSVKALVNTGPGAFRVTQTIAAAAAISGIAAGRRTCDRR